MISFLIVNWNGGDVFKRCVASLHATATEAGISDYEIVVVDNDSKDLDEAWLAQIPRLQFIRNADNLGFAKGTNQTIAAARGDHYFILNNDIVLDAACLRLLMAAMARHHADAVVPRLVYPTGRLQKSVTGLPTLGDVASLSFGLDLVFRRKNRWLMNDFDYTKEQVIAAQPAFTALFIKRDAWHQVGPMDEQFPLLWNDVDWFKRFYAESLRCAFVPAAFGLHVHGMSTGRRKYKKVWESTRGMYRYFRKHHGSNAGGGIPGHGLLLLVCAYTLTLRMTREFFIKSRTGDDFASAPPVAGASA